MPFRCFWTINKGERAGAKIESRIMQINTKNSIRQLCMHTKRRSRRGRDRGWAQLKISMFTLRIKCLTFNRIAYLPQLTNRWKRQLQTFHCNKSLNARFTLSRIGGRSTKRSLIFLSWTALKYTRNAVEANRKPQQHEFRILLLLH